VHQLRAARRRRAVVSCLSAPTTRGSSRSSNDK
jgi:hypothetical protein